jgi:hypothetical protein
MAVSDALRSCGGPLDRDGGCAALVRQANRPDRSVETSRQGWLVEQWSRQHVPRQADATVPERTDVSLALHTAVERELEPSERVAWIAMPRPRLLTLGTVSGSIFGALCTAMVLLGFVNGFPASAQMPSGVVAGVLGFGLFALMGLSLLLMPLWAYRRARRTVYVISDRRAIIILATGRATTIQSFWPDQLHTLTCVERRSNLGDVVLSRLVTRFGNGRVHTSEVGFYNIRAPRAVEARLRHLAASHAGTPNSNG